MKKEERLRVYKMYDGHCAYCGKSIKYEDMQVDHIVPKNRGHYSRWSAKDGKFIVSHGEDKSATICLLAVPVIFANVI